MSTKKALKSIKAHLEEKNHESALYEATQLLKDLKPDSPEAPQVLVFRGLALTQAEKLDEAEKSYLHAYRLQPSLPLASLGLRKLYEKSENWEKLGRLLEVLLQAAYDEDDGDRCASLLQELLELRRNHGPEDKLYRTLYLLLPSSPLVPLLHAVPPPAGGYEPFPSPIYPPPSFTISPQLPKSLPHALHLLASLPLLLNLLIRSQVLVHNAIEAKVKAGRMRIGGGTEKEVRRAVEAEVLGGELGLGMVDLLREVAGHPGVEESVRREVEVREFGFWKKLVGALSDAEEAKPAVAEKRPADKPSKDDPNGLPSTPLFEPPKYTKPTKAEALTRANGLADGFVLLGVSGEGLEDAWSWVIEGQDEPSLFYNIDLLHKFARAFPLSPLTDFIDDYCRWFKLPLPEPEEEAEVSVDGATNGEATPAKKEKRSRWAKKSKGSNARDRRKARRQAGKDGVLAEDIDQEERDELIASMTKSLDKLKTSIFAHRVLARISIEEEDWANAIAYAEKGRTLLKELETDRGITLSEVRLSLETALGVALVPYYSPKHHPRATRLLNTVLGSQPTNYEARFARAQIFQAAGNWSEARKHFQLLLDHGGDEKKMVGANEELAWCLVNEGQLEKGRDILESVVEIRDGRHEKEGKDDEAYLRARAWYRLGRTEWMIGDAESKQHAEDWFMASIRALPTFAPSYTSLGVCYSSATPPDQDRALKCFQKAFELDATEADAARRLAIGYADEDEWAQVRLIATRVMEGEGGVEGVAGGEAMNAKGRFAPKNGWAWKALGSTEMHYKNYARAAQALQIALRAEPEDGSTWALLGESYVKCGRHVAGLKALNHVLDLDPSNWMALYHIADVHSQLGSFDLAVESYEKVDELTGGKELGVTAALATTQLSLGRQTGAGGFRERSRRAFHSAIQLAVKVLNSEKGNRHRPWAWKLIGDSAFELSNQESMIEDAEQSAEIIRPVLEMLVADDQDRRSAIQGLGHASNLLQAPLDLDHTLKAAAFAYAYRAHLLKNEPRVSNSALYDLATALHSLGLRSDGEIMTSCVKGAISAIRLALERDGGDERLWNALGVICSGAGKQVAQHAFVVSLELYSKDPIVWCNLGYLYLNLDDRELASQCFLKSQIIDPDYARAWLGQGMLAERNGDHDHAKGLFTHAVTLSAGSLLEADLALAIAIFEPFLQPGSHLDPSSLHQPAFALRHYVHQRPKDARAAHLYALICERIGLIDEACSALESATELLEQSFEATESVEVEQKYTVALLNLGRVRLAAGTYETSLEAFTNAHELLSGSQHPKAGRMKIQCGVGQGLAEFWLGHVDESLAHFQHALDECSSSQADKEQVAIILARTLWGLGGEEAKDLAKSQLMECLSGDNPSIKVISTLSAVALSSSDLDLLDASISELAGQSAQRKAVDDPTGLSDLVLYANALSQGDEDAALAALQAAVQARPGDAVGRNRLAKALLASGKVEEASTVLAGGLAGTGGDSALIAETLRLKGIAAVLEGADESNGLGALQKSIMLRPWEQTGWEGLAWARKATHEVDEAAG